LSTISKSLPVDDFLLVESSDSEWSAWFAFCSSSSSSDSSESESWNPFHKLDTAPINVYFLNGIRSHDFASEDHASSAASCFFIMLLTLDLWRKILVQRSPPESIRIGRNGKKPRIPTFTATATVDKLNFAQFCTYGTVFKPKNTGFASPLRFFSNVGTKKRNKK
jgi:hypothetical protein